MLNPSRFLALTGVLLFSLGTASAVSADYADPPERVARLSDTQGDVSYSPAGEDEWLGVVRNRPLIRGDRLWAGHDARAEFQVGSAAVRLGSNTGVEILDLSDQIAQVRMTQGTLNLRVRRMYPGQVLEVATPTLAFTIDQGGRYRIDVDPRSAVTTIVVWEGGGEAYGENANFPLRAGDTVRFYDTDLRDYELYGLPREDDFDRYCLDRDQRLARSASLRYVDDDVAGYADLDEYGSWYSVSSYGNVWFPSRVDADWAPYRDGHWVWQEPWGWTWVDDAPWGFAPSHYGRWVNVSNRWGWVPGPRNVRPVYAPALVAFVGSSGWSLSISLGGGSPVGWFPLGPREAYVPSYQASRDYFTRVNVNNTVINNTTITNVYNNYSRGTINVDQVNYANRTVAGAVTAVPSSVFVNAQPVRRSAIRLDRKAATTGEVTRLAPIAPSVRSVIGAGTAAGARPSREAFDRRVFVRNAPPPGERPFAARAQQLQKTPGRAPEPGAVKSVPGRDDNAAQKLRVIGEQRGAVDARAAGSRRGSGKPGTPSAAPGQLRPLDRSVGPGNVSVPVPGDRSRDKEQKGQGGAQQQEQQQQAERKRQVETQQQQQQQQQQAAEKQQAERKRQVETQQQQEQQQQQRQRDAQQQQQAVEKQQAERKRQVETQQQQQAAEKQQAERKRQVETQQQQEQQQQQRQRDAQQQQQAAEKQQAERKRQVETQQLQQQQQQAAEKQQAERKRQVETQQQQQLQQQQRDAQQQQQAAEKQQAERKRQVETQQLQQQQQQAAEKQQAERKRQVETQQLQQQRQQAAEKQQAERKRQVETQQLQEQQRQRDAQQQQQAAEKQQAERKRQVETQQLQQQQQQAAEKQQAERKRQVETQQLQEQQRQRDAQQQQQAAEKQQAERKRQVETQQLQEQQRQRDAQQQQQAAEKQQAERKRQVETQQLQQQQQQAAEKQQAQCERQAILKHQDVGQCRSKTPPQESPGDPSRGKKGK